MFRLAMICAVSLLALIAFTTPTTATAADGTPDNSTFTRGNGMPYAAFDALPKTDIAIGNAVLHVGFAPGELQLPQAAVLAWITRSAAAVSGYYGRFPVGAARILIVPVAGRGVRGGTTWAYRGAAIRILLGREASADELDRDWMLVHEMVHLALPQVGEEHNWLSEGLATYVEPIARAQAGGLSRTSIWAAMQRDMGRGQPQAGDQGLDVTHTWARTYWGGALFALLADVEIRKQSGNRLGLQDALRGVLADGGNHEADWPIERVLASADRATGLHVLTTMYASMATHAVNSDLDALWLALGVRREGDTVSFDDHAPLAATRSAIDTAHH